MSYRVHVAKPGPGWQSRAVPILGFQPGDIETVVIVPDIGNGNRLVEKSLKDVALCDEKCSICPPSVRPALQTRHEGDKPSDSHPRANTGYSPMPVRQFLETRGNT